MAQTNEDDMKVFAQIHAMEEGDLKATLVKAFMQHGTGSSNSSSSKKPNFVDASYDRNTKSYLQHNSTKVRGLTLGEVSKEIHNLKSEINSMKSEISVLKQQAKHGQQPSSSTSGRQINYTLHSAPGSEVKVAEGKFDA